MARQAIKKRPLAATVRMTGAVREELERLLFSRYPRKEWATFFVFGVRETNQGAVLTIADVLTPEPGDLNPDIAIVEFREQYTVRAAMFLRTSPLCIGVIHSHPQDVQILPSSLDDDMDSYYREYFSGFSSSSSLFQPDRRQRRTWQL